MRRAVGRSCRQWSSWPSLDRQPCARATRRRAARSARDAAPIDLTGYWVSYVTENWRYRMVTPAKGEYRRIPASPAALPLINAWDPAADERAGNQCKSYGAGAIMNVPGRLHITWQDANTLRIDTDAGTQTRLFRFSPARPPRSPPQLAGRIQRALGTRDRTRRRWQPARRHVEPARRLSAKKRRAVQRAHDGDGALRHRAAPRRQPTSARHHHRRRPCLPDGPYIVSPHFKKEPDGSKWDPTPCSSTW